MVLLVIMSVVLVMWCLKGYINYKVYYHQALFANYIDRKGLPYPTHSDFKASESELSQSRWSDIKLIVFTDRFPFNRIPIKYLPWL